MDIQTLEKFDQNASLFRSLAQSKVISEELTKEIEDMARFRNLLVHLYWEIDHERIYNEMVERIETRQVCKRDFNVFRKRRKESLAAEKILDWFKSEHPHLNSMKFYVALCQGELLWTLRLWWGSQ